MSDKVKIAFTEDEVVFLISLVKKSRMTTLQSREDWNKRVTLEDKLRSGKRELESLQR